MNVWVLYNNVRLAANRWFAARLVSAFSERGTDARLVVADTADDLPCDLPDIAVNRSADAGIAARLEERGVRLWNNAEITRICHDELKEAFSTIGQPTALLQEPASDLGKDLRVYVLGSEILIAMLRRSETGFRSNFCLGGTVERCDPIPPEVTRQVRRITDRFGFGLAGIDFIFNHGRPVFNEIEDAVGTRMLYAYTDIDAAAVYADFVLKRVS